MHGLTRDLMWVTKQIWTFVSRHVTKHFRKTLRSLVDGEKLIGLEPWRVLFLQHEDGAAEVEVADLGRLA